MMSEENSESETPESNESGVENKNGENGAVLANDIEDVLRYTRAGRAGDEKIILASVDFSDSSFAALQEASKFCDLMDARLVVLHVVHDPGEMPGYYAKLMKKKRVALIHEIAASVFDEFMEKALESFPDSPSLAKALRLMVIGLPVARVIEVVSLVDPEMLVIGSKGRTGIQQLLLGSKAAQLVQMCPVSITIVKSKTKESE
ncbi:MAG: universal stress protein [Gammaproteobacteria bacterium]|jgi:nucleotide-binding universal stress UspA family protein|nr:universal stress protein [Gammaproteobacteria bacterium]MBT4491956.1 universal stress protein [Gammaproteobacteria bacterium]